MVMVVMLLLMVHANDQSDVQDNSDDENYTSKGHQLYIDDK